MLTLKFATGAIFAPDEDELLELLLDEEELEEELELLLELLDDAELEDEELLLEDDELLEDELELLLEEELEDEELLLEEELLDELEELELELPPDPVQAGATKLPSCVPVNPKPVLWPGCRACQLQQLVKVQAGYAPDLVTFQKLSTVTGSLNITFTDQPPIAVVPVLVTLIFTW